VSTAVIEQLPLRLNLESVRGLWGNIRRTWAISWEDFPQSPYSLQLFCTKSVTVFQPSPTTGRTNSDGNFPSRVNKNRRCKINVSKLPGIFLYPTRVLLSNSN
jgi:hypothetical protein